MVVILYGSETGTAAEHAQRIGRVLKHVTLVSKVLFCGACNDVNVDISECTSLNPLLMFLSTTGDGDPPRNMSKFWRYLMSSKRQVGWLNNVKFVMVGFGNSNYSQYNVVAKKVMRRMEYLGASLLMEDGILLINENDDVDPNALILKMMADFVKKCCCNSQNEELHFFEKLLDAALDEKPAIDGTVTTLGGASHEPSDSNITKSSRVVSNTRVTSSDHFQDVRLISISSDQYRVYSPGDVVCIWPKNSPEHVETFFRLIQWRKDIFLQIIGPLLGEVGPFLHHTYDSASETTVVRMLDVVEQLFDLNAVPNVSFFEMLAYTLRYHYPRPSTKEEGDFFELQTDTLFELIRNVDDRYFEYATRPRRSIVEALEDFSAVARFIPISYLLTFMPRIRSRAFSVAGFRRAADEKEANGAEHATSEHITKIHSFELLIGLVEYKTRLKRPRVGLCSRYVQNLREGDSILVERSQILSSQSASKLLNDYKKALRNSFAAPPSLLLIGPGTGLAVCRAYLQSLSASRLDNGPVSVMLCTGNRFKSKDFLCGEELMRLRSILPGFELCCTFSRDGNAFMTTALPVTMNEMNERLSRLYVQNSIVHYGNDILSYVKDVEKMFVLISGGSKNGMPKEVENALTTVFGQTSIERLKASGRLRFEVWD